MSTDIRIPDDRLEESRILEYRDGIESGQFRLKDAMIMMAIASAIFAGVRAIVTHADKPSTAVIHSQP